MTAITDEFNDSTVYRHARSPSTVSSRTDFHCYISNPDSGPPRLRLRFQYVSGKWLFMKSAMIKVGDQQCELDFRSIREVRRDNSAGKIWEWYDRAVTEDDLRMLRVFAGARQATIRLHGNQYRHDHEMSHEEIVRIRLVLQAYALLEGPRDVGYSIRENED